MKEADRLASSSTTGNELLSTGSNAQCKVLFAVKIHGK